MPAKQEKGRAAYEKHVAKAKFPHRFKLWHQLSPHLKAVWAAGGQAKFDAAVKKAAAKDAADEEKP